MNQYQLSMLAMLGIPPFSLIVGLVLVASVAALILGVSRWRQNRWKVIACAAGLVLLALAFVVICVLITVESGSMG